MKLDRQHVALLVLGPTVAAFAQSFISSGSVFTVQSLTSAAVSALLVGLSVLKQFVDAGKAVTTSTEGK